MSTGLSHHSGNAVTDAVAELILLAIERAAAAARARSAPPPRRGVGATLRPGDETPMWNALVERALPHLKPYGSQAILARELGVSRQRVHEYFIARTRQPDAERTLLILTWVIQRESPDDLFRRLARPARSSAGTTGKVSPNR